MYALKDVLFSSRSNPSGMGTLTEANGMRDHWVDMDALPVGGLVINTMVAGAYGSAELIPLDEIEPQPPAEVELTYLLEVYPNPSYTLRWPVGYWMTAVELHGLQYATATYLSSVDPNWTHNSALVAKVMELPGLPAPPPA